MRIDPENEVFGLVIDNLLGKHDGLLFGQVPPTQSMQLGNGYVHIEMFDNPIYQRAMTTTSIENARNPNFQVDVYSSRSNVAKEHSKSIAKDVDTVMRRLGYINISYSPLASTPNYARITMRYRKIETRKNY